MTVQSGPHILAIGEALIDVVMTYEQPDFPVEIPGGSPANVALTLGRLGRPVARHRSLARRLAHVDGAGTPGRVGRSLLHLRPGVGADSADQGSGDRSDP